MVDLSRYASIIREEHLPALGKSLRRIPDFSWLLDAPNPEQKCLQGDLLGDFPTAYLGDDGVPRMRNFTVMVLNNSCDLPVGRTDFITVAPVTDFNEYLAFERRRSVPEKRSEESLQGFAEAVRGNKKTELLYLPAFEGFPHGAIVLLHLLCSVSAKMYGDAIANEHRVASFTQTGFYFLLIKVTTHLARAESADVSRAMIE